MEKMKVMNISQLVRQYGSHITQGLNTKSLEEALPVMKLQDELLRKVSELYVVMYLIDLDENSYIGFSNDCQVDDIVTRYQNAQAVMNLVVENYIRPQFKEDMRAFVDLRTLAERLQGSSCIKCDYQGSRDGWCCAQFAPIGYDEHGKLTHVLFFVDYIGERKFETQIYQNALEYNADYLYHFDLTEGRIKKDFREIRHNLLPSGEEITLPMEYDTFVEKYFEAIGWEPIKNYTKIYKRNEILQMYEQGVTRFQTEYYSKVCERYYRSEFYLLLNKENDHIIAMVVRTDITKEYTHELEAQKELEKMESSRDFLNMAMSAFAESYENVFVAEPDRDVVTIIKQEGYVPELVEIGNKQIKYSRSFENYINARIAEEDRERVRELMRPETIRKNMENRQEMRFAYQGIEDGKYHDFEIGIIKTSREGVYVIGFTNIDELMIEEKRKQAEFQKAIEGMKRSEIYLEAISSSYDCLMIINLSKNSYDIVMRNDCMTWDVPLSGDYAELCAYLNEYFPENVKEAQDKKRTVKNYLEQYYNGETYWEERHQIYTPDGALHWIHERVMCSRDGETGDIIGVSVASVIDKEVEQEENFRQITEALSGDYVNVYLINPRKDQITPVMLKGYSTAGLNRTIGSVSPYWKLVGAYAKNRVYEEDREQFIASVSVEEIERATENKNEVMLSYRIVDEGVIHDYQVKIIKTEKPDIYIFAFRNIDDLLAEERKRQKMYENALKEAEKANQAKRDFLSRMSHDIRTPINGIVGMSHIMKEQIDSRDSVMDGIEQIERLSKQLELLINDVLEMSRIESGKTELSHENFDLHQMMEGFLPSFGFTAEEKSILLDEIQYDIEHTFVVSSPVHIQRICMNLISNAIKYNREGGSVTCAVKEIPVDSKRSSYEFTVADTGVGMSEDFMAHIFEPFTRAEKQLEAEYNGTGLGMAITKEFVDLLGGTIEIESKPGAGSKIKVTLPLELGEATEGKAEKSKSITFEGKTVLLVEDNKINLKFARFLLEDEHMKVDIAANGQEAVEMFSTSPIGNYDLILMDVMMPVMDGLEATRAIRSMERADAKTVPILAMSANAFTEDVQLCLEAGMNDHIAKPLDIEGMREKISRYL